MRGQKSELEAALIPDMEKLGLEEGAALLKPVHMLHIYDRELLDFLRLKRTRLLLVAEPDIEDDLTNAAVEARVVGREFFLPRTGL